MVRSVWRVLDRRADERHGRGKLTLHTGAVYEGDFQGSSFEGWGHFTWEDKSFYLGQWSKSKHHGYGVMVWASGQIYRGGWYKVSVFEGAIDFLL